MPRREYGWLYTKSLEREKYLALKSNNTNYDAVMTIPRKIFTDLSWWERNIPNASNDIRKDSFATEIFTDACLTGWGAWSGTEKTHGFWSEIDKKHHINFLELKAILYGLKCFARNLSRCNILLRCDNTTAVSYVNRMGSVRYPELSELVKFIWQWCEKREWSIFASYISSKDNWVADRESRCLGEDTEWSLSERAFEKIIRTLGRPKVDLFASNINKKCSKYVSWYRDPGSFAVDAFTLDWGMLCFYAFPPFALVLRVLRKIIQDKAEGIVVVPLWPSQAWYPLFSQLIVGEPCYLKPHPNLLSSPFRSTHPLFQDLTLAAARLSGKRS